MRKDEERWAVFWCNLLSPLFYGEVDKSHVNQFLKELCTRKMVFPDGALKKPSLSTLRRKYNKYVKEGFEELKRKPRKDIGQQRKFNQAVLKRALELKKELPSRSADTINYILRREYKVEVPPSTLYRHLRRHEATRIKLGFSRFKVRKRWSKPYPNDMWVGDFEEGPYVVLGQKNVGTHLSAFIDVHSRYIVVARYEYRQNLEVLTDTLVNAWIVNGLPRALYLDNAKVYCSEALEMACYRNSIKLKFRPVRDPAAGGIIERFFKTVQDQFESEVRAGKILTLDELNLAFSSWLNNRYHKRVHSSTGETPEDRYNCEGFEKRHIDLHKAYLSFSKSELRKVNQDFSDVTINKRHYKVDKKLRGDRVKVLYNFGINKETVLIYTPHDTYLGNGVLHNREKGEIKENRQDLPKVDTVINQLVSDHREIIGNTRQVIDYLKASEQDRPWPFAAFVQKFADLLGRKGGYSTFNSGEIEKLSKTYSISTKLNEEILKKAFAESVTSSFTTIVKTLRKLLQENK